MSTRARFLIAGLVALLVLPACGAGGGNVYVGVGVAGPYYGDPGGYGRYPGYVGRPPVHYWDDEDGEDVEELAGPLVNGAAGAEGADEAEEMIP